MKAITFAAYGEPDVLRLEDVAEPTPTDDDLLVRVRASALNRADTMQRRGHYPPPPGESDILGLELAGEVEAVGANARGFKPGDRVFGLVGGRRLRRESLHRPPHGHAIPDGWDFVKAAAVPEVFLRPTRRCSRWGGWTPGRRSSFTPAPAGSAQPASRWRGTQGLGCW